MLLSLVLKCTGLFFAAQCCMAAVYSLAYLAAVVVEVKICLLAYGFKMTALAVVIVRRAVARC